MKVIKIENEFHDLDKERIQFIIEGTVPSFANSLRRVILGYVDTLAIEEIVVPKKIAIDDERVMIPRPPI